MRQHKEAAGRSKSRNEWFCRYSCFCDPDSDLSEAKVRPYFFASDNAATLPQGGATQLRVTWDGASSRESRDLVPSFSAPLVAIDSKNDTAPLLHKLLKDSPYGDGSFIVV